MATYHTVAQGEHLSSIAEKYGFSDYRTIWNAPENAELKKKRKPHILLPGDRLFIPDRQDKDVDKQSEKRHRFKVKAQPLKLRIVLKDLKNKPIADTQCKLELGKEVYSLTTDGKGLIEQVIPPTEHDGKLTFQDPDTSVEVVIPILIGHLDPIEERTGWQARLNNLGYDAGRVGSEDTQRLKSAIEEFQCDHKLKVDGDCGPKTQAKLKEVHGS